MRISVFESKELQAILLALRGMDSAIAKSIRQQTKRVAEPIWKEAVAGNASTRLETRVLANTARVAISNQNVTLKSAGIGRSLSGGYKPSDLVGGAEFGASRADRTSYTSTSSKGKRFTVTRRTKAQFRPRKSSGYVVMPAAAQVIPRLAALWAQTLVRTFHEEIEKR